LAQNVLKIIGSKRIHKFPPHLSYVATLPDNELLDASTWFSWILPICICVCLKCCWIECCV